MGRTFLERLARFGELPKVPACILVLLLLGGSWAVSYHTGGTKHAYPHLFYVPILLGAFFFRARRLADCGRRGDLVGAVDAFRC